MLVEAANALNNLAMSSVTESYGTMRDSMGDFTDKLDSRKLHSKRVGKMCKYTRNECKRCLNTLETGAEDV